MSVHDSLDNFKKWVEIDVTDSPVRKNILNLIEKDSHLDSPNIIKEIDGKYSPYRKHLSRLGNTQLDVLKSEKTLRKTAYVALAVVKFKKLLNKNHNQ